MVGNPVVKSDRVFLCPLKLQRKRVCRKKVEKEDTMWFIIIVLLIIVILNSVNGEKEMDNEENRVQYNDRVVHPAEYLMR
jgi:hypothetical protein